MPEIEIVPVRPHSIDPDANCGFYFIDPMPNIGEAETAAKQTTRQPSCRRFAREEFLAERRSSLSFQTAFQLGASFNRNLFMQDIGMNHSTLRELYMPRRNRSRNEP